MSGGVQRVHTSSVKLSRFFLAAESNNSTPPISSLKAHNL